MILLDNRGNNYFKLFKKESYEESDINENRVIIDDIWYKDVEKITKNTKNLKDEVNKKNL